MMLRFTTPDTLAGLVTLAGLLFYLNGSALYTAFKVRETDRRHRRHITQRDRYRMVIIAIVVWMVAILPMSSYYNPHQVLTALAEFRSINQTFGWALTVSMVFQTLVPLLAFVTFVRIYIYPSQFAMRVYGDLYVRTCDVRAKVGQPVLVTW